MKLQYLKGSKEMAENCHMPAGFDSRLWNLIYPGHPSHGSSLSVKGLKGLGLIN